MSERGRRITPDTLVSIFSLGRVKPSTVWVVRCVQVLALLAPFCWSEVLVISGDCTVLGRRGASVVGEFR